MENEASAKSGMAGYDGGRFSSGGKVTSTRNERGEKKSAAVFLAALASCRERLRKRWRQRWKNKDKYRGSRDARLSYLGQMDDETKNTSDRERIKFVVKSERSFFPFRIE